MTPVLIEWTGTANFEGWRTEWYCDPPGRSVTFQVVREHWVDGDPAVRKIFEIKLIPATGKQ
jgi:hypothetical protein